MQRFVRYLKTSFICRWLVYSYLRFLFYTYRLEVIDEGGGSLPLNTSTGLYYLWQEHAIIGLFFLYRQGAHGHFVSDKSIEGRIAGFVARRLGLRVMYGNGKPSFMRHALEALEENKRMYMVGDGTSRTAYQLQREIPYMCARTQVPLVYLECRASSALSFIKRWDRLKLPLPFSKITVTIHKSRAYGFDAEHEVVEIPLCMSSSDS